MHYIAYERAGTKTEEMIEASLLHIYNTFIYAHFECYDIFGKIGARPTRTTTLEYAKKMYAKPREEIHEPMPIRKLKENSINL